MKGHVSSSLWRSSIAIVCMAVAGATLRPAEHAASSAREAQRQTLPAAPYAELKRVKLGDIIPTRGPDVYVQLIAIDGAVLLAVNE